MLDESGRLYLVTPMGLGLVHSSDMSLAADAVERGDWQPEAVLAADLPAIGDFARSPQRRAGHRPWMPDEPA